MLLNGKGVFHPPKKNAFKKQRFFWFPSTTRKILWGKNVSHVYWFVFPWVLNITITYAVYFF